MFHYRFLQNPLLGPESRNKVRLLFGARQTGKTQLFRHLLPDAATRSFDLQQSEPRRRFEADPEAFSREVRALPRSVRHVVVDEVQKVPALIDEVQALYDGSPRRWQFFLTGSSARKLRARAAGLLPGRSHAYRLHPVCAWEIADMETAVIARPRAAAQHRRGEAAASLFSSQPIERLLLHGSLPGIRAESVKTADRTLATYVDLYLEEEIRREGLVRDLGPFATFLRLAALESGRQVNLAKLSQESRIPASTLKTYYQVLVDTFVGYWIPAYSRNARRRALSTPRFLFFDVGVRNAAAELPTDTRMLHTEGPALLEQWVGQELLARAEYLGRGHRVSFWRTSTGLEVDWVFETPREDLPFEVKWTENPRADDARHLEAFLDDHSKRAHRGFVLCRCPRPQQLTPRVTALPWNRW
jgi:predicted AAA+ superfamily ATPase